MTLIQRHTRFRFCVLGGHVHVSVFSGKDTDHLGKNGNLTFELGEWEYFRSALVFGSEACNDGRVPSRVYTVDFVEEVEE